MYIRNAYAEVRAGRPLRRVITASALAALVLGGAPALASADSSSTLTVVGTSDVSDSGLMANVIQPAFQAAYPQFTFKYIGSASGTAIQAAEGKVANESPSALIVHAASLENQFVASGYSDNNQYGNAVFRNDFVIAGPASNESTKANVAANGANNAAQAFADIAAAGVAGNATFVSRGGSVTASGTTVEEHAIWALAFNAGLLPSNGSVVVCDVSAADGGGMSPINPAVQSTSGQACPDSGTVNPTGAANGNNPSWYQVDNVSQAAALQATNSCTFGNANGSCYMLSDRGTFDYLSDGGTASGGPSTIPNLAIVTRNDSASAPGGRYGLINYFHAYVINPSASGESVNLTAAQDFVSLLTSPSMQQQISQYLASTGDSGGAPFVPDASPIITAAGLPSSAAPGAPVTVSGNVSNAEIGYPSLAGENVQVDEIQNGIVIPVANASTTTDNNGNYSITFAPPSSGSYQVVTGQISQVENPSLSPVFGDLLTPGASPATAVTLTTPATPASPAAGTVTLKSVRAESGPSVRVEGTLGPAAPDANGRLVILARKQGSRGGYTQVGGATLKQGSTTFDVTAPLAAGKWQVETTYVDQGSVNAATSRAVGVTIPNTVTSAGFKRSSVKRGQLTLSGSLSQAAPATSTVELLGVQTARISGARIKTQRVKVLARTTVRAGRSTFTVKKKLVRGYRYDLQLGFVEKGRATTYSRTILLSVS